jgi:uncharacterized protein YgiM (DUF1202 family)
MRRLILGIFVLGTLTNCTSSEEPKTAKEPVAPEQAKAPEAESGEPQTVINQDDAVQVTTYNRTWEEYVMANSSAPGQTPMSPVTPPVQSVEPSAPEDNYLKVEGLLQPDIQSNHIYNVQPTEAAPAKAYYVQSAGLNVRTGPAMTYSVVRQLPQGARVEALGQEGIWVQIGASEYVSRNFLSEEPSAAGQSITLQNNK